MLEFLKNYPGKILINDNEVGRENFQTELNSYDGQVIIKLIPENCLDVDNKLDVGNSQEYIFYVKSWMLEKSSTDLPFMKIWNDDNPMPLRYMRGIIIKQTSRMYYVHLRGVDSTTDTCKCCGRMLVNPTSKLLGIGPECCLKLGINPNIFLGNVSKQQIQEISDKISHIFWEGWIPKTGILKVEEI